MEENQRLRDLRTGDLSDLVSSAFKGYIGLLTLGNIIPGNGPDIPEIKTKMNYIGSATAFGLYIATIGAAAYSVYYFSK